MGSKLQLDDLRTSCSSAIFLHYFFFILHFDRITTLSLFRTDPKMKISAAATLLLAASASAFAPTGLSTLSQRTALSSAATETDAKENSAEGTTKDPLLIRAARGEETERTPVWMMRQAGRHIKEYRDLCKEYPTFRQRSEIPEVAVEVSLQPWRNYQTDGCILFSDILTPLPGMGVEFDIEEKVGPVVEPMRTWESIEKVR